MSAMIENHAFDRAHLFVADAETAVAWHGLVPGLRVLFGSARLDGEKHIAAPRGQYGATIFRGKPPSDSDHTAAFQVVERVFMAFGDALPHEDVMGRDGHRLRSKHANDQDLAVSRDTQNPDENRFEITTCEHEPVREWFRAKNRAHTQ